MDYSSLQTGRGSGWGLSSAGPGAAARELAIGLVAAVVDALQAFRDDCPQLENLFLLVGFFGIHRNQCYDVNCDGRRQNATMPAS